MSEYNGSERRESHWHLSKSIPIATIMSLIGMLMAGVSWAEGTSIRMENIEEAIEEATQESKDHVRKTELSNILATQEYKITVIADDVKDLKSTLKENQQLMIKMLQRLPEKQN